ncbi:MAG: phosphoglycolate phosphatase [Alphaproteobacteria bacterium]|nr:phosphoglycolate phosphatase [Alphaproteobacteria bacterium]
MPAAAPSSAFRRPFRAQAVLFDLDGTLIDSAPDLQAAVNRLLLAMERRPLDIDQVKAMIGDGAAKLVERAMAASGAAATAEALPELVQRFMRLYTGSNAVQRTTAYAGVPETLAALGARGLKLAVCTNKPYRATMGILSALKLTDHFAEVVGGDSLAQRKPDPAPARHLLEKLGVGAEAAVMVGDSANDVATGRGAGLACIAVSWGYSAVPPERLGADRVVDRFADIPAAIAALEREGLKGALAQMVPAAVSDLGATLSAAGAGAADSLKPVGRVLRRMFKPARKR